MDNLETVILNAMGKTDVGRAVQKNRVAGCSEGAQCADHTAEHAVLIPYIGRGQVFNAVALALPTDDCIIISPGGGEIPVGRVGCAPNDCFRD